MLGVIDMRHDEGRGGVSFEVLEHGLTSETHRPRFSDLLFEITKAPEVLRAPVRGRADRRMPSSSQFAGPSARA